MGCTRTINLRRSSFADLDTKPVSLTLWHSVSPSWISVSPVCLPVVAPLLTSPSHFDVRYFVDVGLPSGLADLPSRLWASLPTRCRHVPSSSSSSPWRGRCPSVVGLPAYTGPTSTARSSDCRHAHTPRPRPHEWHTKLLLGRLPRHPVRSRLTRGEWTGVPRALTPLLCRTETLSSLPGARDGGSDKDLFVVWNGFFLVGLLESMSVLVLRRCLFWGWRGR